MTHERRKVTSPKRAVSGLLVGALIATSVLIQTAWADHSPGELIVRLRGLPQRSTLDQVQQCGVAAADSLIAHRRAAASLPLASSARRFPAAGSVVLLRFGPDVSMDSLELALSRDPAVEWVTRNHHYRTTQLVPLPNDSLISEQWWLQQISAPQAWQTTPGDSTILIGILDTGVDYLHPDLRANIWINRADADSNGIDDDNNGFVDDGVGWDFTDAPSLPGSGDNLVRDNDPMDEFGHGTYVAGLVAATANNSLCYAGIAHGCRILCLKAGTSEGYLEEDDVAAALLYAAQMEAAVVNMSFGDRVASPLLREAVQLAHSAGVTLIASAGNRGTTDAHYPSGFPGVISVGATDRFDRRTSFSNYGPMVDVMAPGMDIVSTINGGTCGLWIPTGTSFSAPMVSAVAGLVLSVNPDLSPDDVQQIIMSTADDLRFGSGSQGWDDQTAHGRLNAQRAVQQARFGADVVARITTPVSDSGVQADFPVSGEAWGAAFERYEVSYGIGANPQQWQTVASGSVRVYGGILGTVPIPPYDTLIVLRLEVRGTGGMQVMDHVRVHVQRSAPQFESLRVLRMLDQATYGDMVEIESNQFTRAGLILTNLMGDSAREDFGYVDTTHTGILSQSAHPGAWQVRVRLENTAGLVTTSDPFPFEVSEPPFVSNLWTRIATSLPHGLLGAFTTDYNCNGRPEVWVAPLVGGFLANLAAYEWTGSDFVLLQQTDSVFIPQAVGDADENGLLEMIWRRGLATIIWEQSSRCSPFDRIVYRDMTNSVGAAFIDWDSLDGHGEIIIRRYTGPGTYDNPRYVIYSVGDGYSLTARDTLPNETAGNNELGPPKLLIGDLDGDQLQDFLYADRDGDLIFDERSGSRVIQKWTMRLPFDDATTYLAAADLDGDGALEFVAGCRSTRFAGTESQIRRRHWKYYVFKCTGNDQFAAVDSVFILGAEEVSNHPASVTAADVDGDGRAEILISAFPDFYILRRDELSGRYLARWYYAPSESYAILTADWDGNGLSEFFYSDGNVFLRGEAASASGQRPPPPLNLTGEPLGPTAVYLIWNAVAEADSYRVYRAGPDMVFRPVASAADTLAVIANVPENELFTYAVGTLSSTYPIPESVLSNYVVLTANEPPSCEDTAEFIEPHFVAIRFSEVMGASALWQWAYRLDDDRMPAAVTSGEGGRRIFLSFDESVSEGIHSIAISGIRDSQGSLLPESESLVWFVVARDTVTGPRVLSHRLIGGPAAERVEIVFSQPMSPSVLQVSNFRMESPHGVSSVRALTGDRREIEVTLDSQAPVGALGMTARLMLRNLTNEGGVAMDTSGGRADLLLGGTAAGIADAYVFPNPYRGTGAGGAEGVMFAGLPEQATIRIFTLNGLFVRKIEHRNLSGGSLWDLRNESGDPVAAGIYLYTIHSGDDIVRGKLAVMR